MKTNKIGTKRGMNPNSHGNNIKTTENKTVGKEITLLPKHWEITNKLGDGNHSRGARILADIAISAGAKNIDKLFSILPVLGKAKIALQMLLDSRDKAEEYAESVLLDLEDLEIESAYLETETDGIFQETKGSWGA